MVRLPLPPRGRACKRQATKRNDVGIPTLLLDTCLLCFGASIPRTSKPAFSTLSITKNTLLTCIEWMRNMNSVPCFGLSSTLAQKEARKFLWQPPIAEIWRGKEGTWQPNFGDGGVPSLACLDKNQSVSTRGEWIMREEKVIHRHPMLLSCLPMLSYTIHLYDGPCSITLKRWDMNGELVPTSTTVDPRVITSFVRKHHTHGWSLARGASLGWKIAHSK